MDPVNVLAKFEVRQTDGRTDGRHAIAIPRYHVLQSIAR